MLGSWFDAKMRETTGKGEKTRPRWTSDGLLNIRRKGDPNTTIDPKTGRAFANASQAAGALRNMTGIRVRDATT